MMEVIAIPITLVILVLSYVISQVCIFAFLINGLRNSAKTLSDTQRGLIFWAVVFAPTLLLLAGVLTLAEWKGDTGEFGWFYMINVGYAGLITMIVWLIAGVSLDRTLRRAKKRLYESWINLVMVLTMAAICIWRACAIMIIGHDWPEEPSAVVYIVAFLRVFFPLAPGVNLLLLAVYICTRRKLTGRFLPVASFSLAWLGGLAATVYAKIILAHQAYEALPDTPPECFIVTAAARGNRRFVGSGLNPTTGRIENAQLARMRTFERYLMTEFPNAHRRLRAVYNRLGPVVARRIRHPLAADLTYVILKPLELLAVIICGRTSARHGDRL